VYTLDADLQTAEDTWLSGQTQPLGVVAWDFCSCSETVGERGVQLFVGPLDAIPKINGSCFHYVEEDTRHPCAVEIVEIVTDWVHAAEVDVVKREADEVGRME